jgi:hypothetical protein
LIELQSHSTVSDGQLAHALGDAPGVAVRDEVERSVLGQSLRGNPLTLGLLLERAPECIVDAQLQLHPFAGRLVAEKTWARPLHPPRVAVAQVVANPASNPHWDAL